MPAGSPVFDPAAGFAGLLECSPQACRGLFGGLSRMEEESVFGICRRDQSTAPQSCSSLPESCSDVGSFDSENDSSFCWMPSSSTLKSDDDICGRPGSPPLFCGEEDALDEDDEDATQFYGPGQHLGTFYNHQDAEETLRTELGKERDLGPLTVTPILPEYRGILVQWMKEVCAVRSLSPATFFTATSILDRFLRASGEGATPLTLLQLVALTCVALAAKNEQQQSAGELLSLAKDEHGNHYKAEDARRMEYQVMHLLEWRLRVPTLYTFASMFMHRIINRPQDGAVVPPGMEQAFRKLVLQLAELATLDHELTAVSYSKLAVACLLVAETEIKGGGNDLQTVTSMRTINCPAELSDLAGPVQRLYYVYKSVSAAAPPARS